MSLKIYNTQTRSKETFVPLNEGKVGMYVCGVTVYDQCHIGHARAYVSFDVVQRYLRYRGYDVTYVRNFTDIDDKIIARAAERGVTINELTDRFIKEYHEDMEALGVAKADVEPRVTDHVTEIIEMITTIINRGHGYVVNGDVYFDIESYPQYLGLSGRKLEDMKAGASERVGGEKVTKHPMDFVLWKAAKPGEPAWDSPWGKGRPGWHIECSTMSAKYLGEVFDIHGGGADLIFPHHENERAQSWASSGHEFVRYWMHNGFVKIDDEKMSKSLGNFFTIKQVIERYHPESLRYFLLTTHYRSPINFYDGAITEAENRVEYLYEALAAANAWLQNRPGKIKEEEIDTWRSRIVEVMDDDINSAAALGILATAARALNDALAIKGKAPEKSDQIATMAAVVKEIGNILGLSQRDPSETLAEIQARKLARSGLDPARIEAKLEERAQARQAKDFAKSDAIRDELLAMGVSIMDGPDGTRWKVV